MQFREQIEKLIQCKVDDICARDALITRYLINRSDTSNGQFDSLLENQQMDNQFILELIRILDYKNAGAGRNAETYNRL